MLCCRAPLAYMVTETMSTYPSDFRGKKIQLLFPRHSWCGCVTLLFPPFVAGASCCACDSALGLAGHQPLKAFDIYKSLQHPRQQEENFNVY